MTRAPMRAPCRISASAPMRASSAMETWLAMRARGPMTHARPDQHEGADRARPRRPAPRDRRPPSDGCRGRSAGPRRSCGSAPPWRRAARATQIAAFSPSACQSAPGQRIAARACPCGSPRHISGPSRVRDRLARPSRGSDAPVTTRSRSPCGLGPQGGRDVADRVAHGRLRPAGERRRAPSRLI